MARPQTVTDDQILDAAQLVLARRGSEAFTVSEVAREVGVTRTAIALRFQGSEDIKEQVLRRQVEQFDRIFRELDIVQGAAGLIAIAELVGGMVGERRAFAGFMLRYTHNAADSDRMKLELQRGEILRAVACRAMPPVALPPRDAADAFIANLTGSLMNWHASEEPDARLFLRKRAIDWIRLVGIPLDEGVV